MRILYIIPTLEKGGAESQISLLADRLRGFDHHSSVIALSGGGWWSSYLQERNIPVSMLKFRSRLWPRNIGQFYRLVALIRRQEPDVVISFLYPCSIWASLAARLAGVRLVIASRRDCGFQRNERPLPGWLEKRSYEATTMFVANSHAVARSLTRSEGIPIDQVHVIYNGVDLPANPIRQRCALRKQLGLSDSHLVIGMVSNFWPHKNHLMLVRAAEHIVKENSDVDFILAGGYDDYQIEVSSQIAKMGLDKYFRILGQIDGPHEVLPAIDIGVLCSDTEGFSNTILEYMAYGKPVIATHVGGNPEAVADGDTGCLGKADDPAELASTLLALATDPQRREAMGRRGRLRVESEFSWERSLKSWDELLRSLVPGKRTRQGT